MNRADTDDVRKRVTEAITLQLVACGWTAIHDEPALAHTSVDTAVGLKEASVYLQDWRDGRYPYQGFALTAKYESEGRNVLASCIVNIQVDMTTDQIAKATKLFDANARKAIDQSYARFLKIDG